MSKTPMLDMLTDYYASHHFKGSDEDFRLLSKHLRREVLEETIPLMEENELEEARRRSKEAADAYRRRLIRQVQVSLIVETMFLAFFVGMITNLVTNLLPGGGSPLIYVVLIAVFLILSLLLIHVATAEPKE